MHGEIIFSRIKCHDVEIESLVCRSGKANFKGSGTSVNGRQYGSSEFTTKTGNMQNIDGLVTQNMCGIFAQFVSYLLAWESYICIEYAIDKNLCAGLSGHDKYPLSGWNTVRVRRDSIWINEVDLSSHHNILITNNPSSIHPLNRDHLVSDKIFTTLWLSPDRVVLNGNSNGFV